MKAEDAAWAAEPPPPSVAPARRVAMDGRVALLAWLVVRAAGALPGNKALQERHQAVDRLLAGLAPQGLNVSDAKLIHEFCDQKLDHFDDSNGHTWCQRFAVEAKYYKKGGPVFLCLDGEDFPWMHHSALLHLRTCNNMAPRTVFQGRGLENP